MQKIIKLFLPISLMACIAQTFAAEVPENNWKLAVKKAIVSKKFKAGMAGVGTAAIVTAVCMNSDKMKESAVTTWEDVQGKWEEAQKSRISRGTVMRTALAVAGVTATGVAGKSLYDSVDKKAVMTYGKQKLQEARDYITSLSTTAKVTVVGGAAMLTGAAAYGIYKKYTSSTMSDTGSLTPLEELKNTFTVDQLNKFAIADINIEILFATAIKQPTVLLYENEFYNTLSESQKILVGLVIQIHGIEDVAL